MFGRRALAGYVRGSVVFVGLEATEAQCPSWGQSLRGGQPSLDVLFFLLLKVILVVIFIIVEKHMLMIKASEQ